MGTQFDSRRFVWNQWCQTEVMLRQLHETSRQSEVMESMAKSLDQIQRDMGSIRRLKLAGLAIQEEMIQKDRLQARLEEFIYTTQKMVAEFSADTCVEPPSARYFSLKGVAETVQENDIGTMIIRGIDNKAAFDLAMNGVQRLTRALENHPEVVEALAWIEAKQKRLADEKRKRKAERRRTIVAETDELVRMVAEEQAERHRSPSPPSKAPRKPPPPVRPIPPPGAERAPKRGALSRLFRWLFG